MGVGENMQDAAADFKDKMKDLVPEDSVLAERPSAAGRADAGDGAAPGSGVGADGHTAAEGVDLSEPGDRANESKHDTVQSEKIQGL